MLTRFITGIFSVALAYFTVVQYNDPDGWLWMAFYGAGMMITTAAAVGRYSRPATLLTIGISIAVAAWLIPSVLEWLLHHQPSDLIYGMSPSRPYIEQSRESLGALIQTAILIYVYRQIPVAATSASSRIEAGDLGQRIPVKAVH